MTRQIIRTPHGDYEIIQTARGFYIQDPMGYNMGLFSVEEEAVAAVQERLGL